MKARDLPEDMTILELANGRFDSPAEDVSLASITNDSVDTLRELNAVLFPIPYSERFYNAVVTPELSRFCKIIYLNGKAVGTVCCRPIEDGETKLYIMTMGVLADYRDKRLGSKALQDVIDAARSSENPRISSIFMHVWAMNPDAKRFYERHGFVETRLAVNYYYKAPIECKDAWVLELRIHPTVAKGEEQVQRVEQDDVSSAADKSDHANGTA